MSTDVIAVLVDFYLKGKQEDRLTSGKALSLRHP